MLDLSQLKKLQYPVSEPEKYRDHMTGTKLRRLRDMGWNKPKGSIVYFDGFAIFYELDGTSHMTWGDLFKIPGGAKDWNSFTRRGRLWIRDNFRSERGFASLSIWEPPDMFNHIDIADVELAEEI